MSFIETTFSEAQEWGHANGVTIDGPAAIGKVNRVRLASKLPQFIIHPGEDAPLPAFRKSRDRIMPAEDVDANRRRNLSRGAFSLGIANGDADCARQKLPAPVADTLPALDTGLSSNKEFGMADDNAEHIPAASADTPGSPCKEAPRETKKTIQGLADTLFDTIDDVRAGRMKEGEAMVVAKLSAQVISTMNLRIKVLKLSSEMGEAGNGNSKGDLVRLAG